METIDVFNLVNANLNMRDIQQEFDANLESTKGNRHSGSAYLVLLGIKIGQERAREKMMSKIKEKLIEEHKNKN